MAIDFKKRKINLLDNVEETRMKQRPISRKSSSTNIKRKIKKLPHKYKRKTKVCRKSFSCFFITLIILFTLGGVVLSSSNNSLLGGVKNSYFIRQITNIVSPSNKYLAGEKQDRINFVILGMGGPGHNGPYLSDTIIVASFKPSTKSASIFSLPRDMIVPLHKNDYRKINSIYAIGQTDDYNGGELTKEVLSKTLDIDIHYFAAVDFNGFTEIVDAIGGIEVNVETSFTDNQFPDANYGYQEISFEAGEQEMDGLTALRFARSRHGNNGEGSDFARSKRQQKIIMAIKDKVTSFNTLINPKKITDLFSLFNKYTTTDLEPWEAVKLVHMSKGIDTQNIIHQSIDDRPGGYLKAGFSEQGAYILQPITGNYEQIQLLVKNIFELEELSEENAKIIIQNGTDIPGMALEAVNHLNQIGYNVLRYGNAPEQDKITTVIYNYTDNKPKTEESLEAIFQSKSKTKIPLEYSNEIITQKWDIRDDERELEQIDFLIVLGMDQKIEEGVEIVKTIDPLLLSTSTPTSTDNEI